MKTLLVTVLSALFAITFAEPPCHMVELGLCFDNIANYINSLPRRHIPKSEDDMENMCAGIQAFTDCWDDYKKRCMTPIQSELELLILEGARDLQADICTKGSEYQQNYMKHAPCLETVVGSEETSENIDRVVVMYEKFDTVPNTKKLRFFCCGWNAAYGKLKQTSLNMCGADATQTAEDLLSDAISDLPSIICEGYEPTSDQCKKIIPAEGSKPTGRSNPFINGLKYFFKNHLD